MSQEDKTTHVDDVLELAALMRPAWPTISAGIRASGVPVCEGDDDGDGGQGDDGAGDGDGDGQGAGQGDGDPETFDRDYVAKLRRENAAARKRAQEAEARVKEFEDAGRSELEKAQETATTAAQRAEAAESKLLRYEVGAEKGVPAKLMKFLTGSTKEELEASADELLTELGERKRTSFDGGPRDRAQTGGMDDAIRAAAGRA